MGELYVWIIVPVMENLQTLLMVTGTFFLLAVMTRRFQKRFSRLCAFVSLPLATVLCALLATQSWAITTNFAGMLALPTWVLAVLLLYVSVRSVMLVRA